MTKKVSVRVRLCASILSALLASWLLGATIDGLDIWGVDTLLTLAPIAIVVTAFVVAGGTNAINIIDGFHGVAASAVIIMLAALGFLAWRQGDMFVT
ncbi:glycosyl transferase, partial [Glaciimonas sp. CA11.2]|nr:glycosyl transferase [Glaciimonas sp. CA11.2]